jgi:hypothetical protein
MMIMTIKILVLDTGTEILHGFLTHKIIKENAPENTIVTPLKVTDNAGHTTNEHLARGLVHALTNNYDIVNISLGLPTITKQVSDILKRLEEHNIIVVASAGNNYSCYPAKHPSVISVGSYEPNNPTEPADYTPNCYDVLENGAYSYKGNTYYGTSYATAYYSAILAHRLLSERSNDNNGKQH